MPVTPPQHRQESAPSKVLAHLAAEAALSKKAEAVVVMNIGSVSTVADFFVLCTGASDNQIRAIQESIEKRLHEEVREKPWHREGQEHRQWVCLDYVDVVIHIFSPELRAFYDLERLWNDAPCELVTGEAEEVVQ